MFGRTFVVALAMVGLAATAHVLDLTLVTADERLMRSKQFAVLANR